MSEPTTIHIRCPGCGSVYQSTPEMWPRFSGHVECHDCHKVFTGRANRVQPDPNGGWKRQVVEEPEPQEADEGDEVITLSASMELPADEDMTGALPTLGAHKASPAPVEELAGLTAGRDAPSLDHLDPIAPLSAKEEADVKGERTPLTPIQNPPPAPKRPGTKAGHSAALGVLYSTPNIPKRTSAKPTLPAGDGAPGPTDKAGIPREANASTAPTTPVDAATVVQATAQAPVTPPAPVSTTPSVMQTPQSTGRPTKTPDVAPTPAIAGTTQPLSLVAPPPSLRERLVAFDGQVERALEPLARRPWMRRAHARWPRQRVMRYGSLLLGFILLAQVALAALSYALLEPESNQSVVNLCRALGCPIPERFDPHSFVIDGVALGPHPDHPNALLLEAELTNGAPFAQGWPILEMQLLDAEGKTIAGRLLAPQEYLGHPEEGQLAPAQKSHFELALLAPPHPVARVELLPR